MKKYTFKELHEITSEDRREIYEYAIKRSKEIVAGCSTQQKKARMGR